MLKAAFLTPHPPVIIPGIGDKESLKRVSDTILAMKKLGDKTEKIGPKTIIFVSPHAPVDPLAISGNEESILKGNFIDFGFTGWEKEKENNIDLLNTIEEKSLAKKINFSSFKANLDHGVLVPLYYLSPQVPYKIIHLAYSLEDLKTHFEFGKVLGSVINKYVDPVILVASGDLSHRITSDAPAGYSPRGEEFDKKMRKMLKDSDWESIINLDNNLIEEAGECGLRSIAITLGALSKQKVRFSELSYECPFGVGYLAGEFIITSS